jgi:hypothetical protein
MITVHICVVRLYQPETRSMVSLNQASMFFLRLLEIVVRSLNHRQQRRLYVARGKIVDAGFEIGEGDDSGLLRRGNVHHRSSKGSRGKIRGQLAFFGPDMPTISGWA